MEGGAQDTQGTQDTQETQDTQDTQEQCCICLSESRKEDPLLLLSCGCKAFFHKACEDEWLSTLNINTPIKCLICKREPVLKVNYSFSRDAGPAQMLMWNTATVFILEIPIGFYCKTPIIFLEGLTIIVLPLIFSFPCDITFFFMQYNIMTIVNIILIILLNKSVIVSNIILYRLLHIMLLSFFINSHNKVDPLIHFVISREITHSKLAWRQ